ncbi:FG-GAP-like repeat-containing protein [Flavobacteriaceae bacterium S356]|uniref:FG-GAP-like repeat-containing protein n=1 Tax=Asprobacillus argus TaxID=3076534 RepID=A0ABU3LDD9_9FLAO|nr:FG-GAP-like repeat-containing protein [Flavobacteriaceae bacterium S356]
MNRKTAYICKSKPLFLGYFLCMFGFFTITTNSQTFSSSTPTANSINAAVNANVVMTFSAAVTLSDTNTIISGSLSGEIAGVFSGGGTMINTFNPDKDFKYGEIITVQLTTATGGPATAYNFSFRAQTATSSVTPSTGFEKRNITTSANGIEDIAVGDLDNDGDLDVITADYLGSSLKWYKNNGAATPVFGTPTTLRGPSVGLGLVSVVLVDSDNDGDLDVFYGGYLSGRVYCKKNTGGGSFDVEDVINPSTTYSQITTVFPGDIDGDGLVDIAFSSRGSSRIGWFKNLGNNNFNAQVTITSSLSGPYSVKLADMDGDGDLDAVGAASTGNDIFWYENTNGDGTTWSVAKTIDEDNAAGVRSVAVGDIDGDGDLDVAGAIYGDDTIAWYENTAGDASTFTKRTAFSGADADEAFNVDLADMDGDGDLDIIWAAENGFGGNLAWSRNDGGSPISWTYIPVDATVNRGYSVDAADLDGDGYLDFLGVSYGDDTASWYEYHSNTWLGGDSNDWNTAANWSEGVVPGSSAKITISNQTNTPMITGTRTINQLSIESSGTLTIDNAASLTVTNGAKIDHGGSLLVNGTFTGTLTYKTSISDTNWHLVAAPVTGETYDNSWISGNGIASGSGINRGISTYINTTDANGDWVYFQAGGSATFNSGQGYGTLRTGSGNYSFIGSLQNTNQTPTITASDIGGANENRWNLLGNPFPSYIDINSFLTTNQNALFDSNEAVYVWNGTAYVPLTTGYIYPGQGFFVSSDLATTSVAINKGMLSHQTSATFYRNANNHPEMEILVSDEVGNNSMTTVSYAPGKTNGLDPRFDLGAFPDSSNPISIYTHLVNDNQGINFMQQALPDNEQGFNNTIIPLSLRTPSATKLTFEVRTAHFPEEVKIYLEDLEKGTFVRLDEDDAVYNVTVNENINGAGRFYIHTISKSSDLEIYPFDVHMYYVERAIHLRGIERGTSVKVTVYDILGKNMLEKDMVGDDLNKLIVPNSIKSGVYIVRVKAKEGSITKKIIVK